MKKSLFCSFFFALGILMVCGSSALAQEVLVLHTASPQSPAAQRLYEAARETLQKKAPSLGAWQYWLEADTDDSEERFDDMVEELETLLTHHTTTGIICNGPAALALLQRYGNKLFQNLPAVFCSVEHFDPSMAGYDHCPGLTVNSGLTTLFTTLLQLHPQLHTLIVFTDHSPEGVALRKETQTVFSGHLKRIQLVLPGFEAGRDQGIDANYAKAVARNAPKGSAIILARTTRDKNGERMEQRSLAEYMANNAEVPVYVLDEDSMHPQTAGSFAPSAAEHGRKAATMLVDLMKGAPLKENPVTVLPRKWTFQTQAMERTTTDFNKLPKMAVVDGTLPQQTHRRFPPGFAALGGLLLGALLAFWFRKKKRM